jgi:hypothetical protein
VGFLVRMLHAGPGGIVFVWRGRRRDRRVATSLLVYVFSHLELSTLFWFFFPPILVILRGYISNFVI